MSSSATAGVTSSDISGPLRFVRFAYPPNALGYCGPPDCDGLLGTAISGGAGAAAMAKRFEGAWPYLRLIAACNGIDDPLDRRVVEAYWLGNRLLEAVRPSVLAASLDDRFERRVRRDFEQIATAALSGGVAHHSFHVFAVYPWLGMLRGGMEGAPLTVLDRCRIRWATVVAVEGDHAIVRGRVLSFRGGDLVLGDERVESARVGVDGAMLLARLQAGDVVALHWDWVCDVLTAPALHRLREVTARNLRAVNSQATRGPAVACERAGGPDVPTLGLP